MALPIATQKEEFGRRVVTTPALVSSRQWIPGDVWLEGHLAVHYNDGLRSLDAGVEVNVTYLGVFEFPCDTAVTAAKDSDAYYDQANRTIVTAPGTNIIYVGRFAKAKTSGQLVARVDLNSLGGGMESKSYSKRVRSTIAEVNAGKTLLPALAGYRYVIRDIKMIAIGGAAGASTTVDVLGTQSTSSVKLLAVAVAALTQSAVVREGAANATVLADGASFAPCDAGAAITLSKTGSALTTATNIDVIIDYVIEAA